MKTFQFKIQLKYTENPQIWRRLLVPDDLTFDDFHIAIQIAFGWENDHLYQFSPKGWGSTPMIGEDGDGLDSYETLLSEIFTRSGKTFTYIYDFGDDWHHQIKLEKISEGTLTNPFCPDGEGACPPEDCGGVFGYYNMVKNANDPEHPEYEEIREWLGLDEGEEWDLNYFDKDEVNEIFSQDAPE